MSSTTTATTSVTAYTTTATTYVTAYTTTATTSLMSFTTTTTTLKEVRLICRGLSIFQS
jgi:hypothetical protein